MHLSAHICSPPEMITSTCAADTTCARRSRIFWSKIVSIAQSQNGQGTALARFSQVRKILVNLSGMEGEVCLVAH